jgi:hypothetical protein
MRFHDMLAVVLAPTIGGLIWWFFFKIAKSGHNFLWMRLPDGRIRRFLLRKVS